jgi:hypothetical protein
VKDDVNGPLIGSPSAGWIPATVTAWVELPGNGSSGVNVADDPLADTVPGIDPTRNDVVVTDAGSTALLKTTVTAAVAETPVAPSGGVTEVTDSGPPPAGVSVGPDSEQAAAMINASAPTVDEKGRTSRILNS